MTSPKSSQHIMYKIFRYKLLILITVFLSLFCAGLTADESVEELKKQQIELRKLLDKIAEEQDKRGEQKAMLNVFERQMSCNWKLIQDYESCETLHKNDLENHLSCKRQAKKNAVECLSKAKINDD